MPSDLVLGGRTFVIPDNATDPTDPELWFTQFAHSLAEQADRVLITSGTLTGASHLTVDGLSPLYKRVVVKGRWTGVSTVAVTAQLRASGVADASSNYSMQYGNDESTSPTANQANATTSAEVLLAAVEGVQFELVITDLGVAAPTWFRSEMQVGVTNPQLREYGAAHNVASAFDGFRLTPASGTLTGEYEVWGELAAGADLALDAMANRYLGAKSSDPTTDNYGNTLASGALYWNTTAQQMKVWSGSAWLPFAGGYAAKTSAYTLAVTDSVIDVTSGTWTLALPTAASASGREYTVRIATGATVTLDPNSTELIAGASTLAVPGAGLVKIVSTGSAWIVLAGQYVSTAAGRAVYTWDAAANGWQLVHGDTGWRTITPVNIANCNEWLAMRRIGFTVFCIAEIQITSGTTLAISDFYSLPSGFQGNSAVEEVWAGGRIGSLGSDQKLQISRDAGSQMLRATAAMSGGTVICSFAFATTDAWPASLPGS